MKILGKKIMVAIPLDNQVGFDIVLRDTYCNRVLNEVMGKEQEQNYAAEHSDNMLDQLSAKSIDRLDTQGLETVLKSEGWILKMFLATL